MGEKEIMHFINFIYGLILLFIGLKLTGHIDWGWLVILSPFWVVLGFGLILHLLGFGRDITEEGGNVESKRSDD